jgi:hypothetical protein
VNTPPDLPTAGLRFVMKDVPDYPGAATGTVKRVLQQLWHKPDNTLYWADVPLETFKSTSKGVE